MSNAAAAAMLPMFVALSADKCLAFLFRFFFAAAIHPNASCSFLRWLGIISGWLGWSSQIVATNKRETWFRSFETAAVGLVLSNFLFVALAVYFMWESIFVSFRQNLQENKKTSKWKSDRKDPTNNKLQNAFHLIIYWWCIVIMMMLLMPMIIIVGISQDCNKMLLVCNSFVAICFCAAAAANNENEIWRRFPKTTVLFMWHCKGFTHNSKKNIFNISKNIFFANCRLPAIHSISDVTFC